MSLVLTKAALALKNAESNFKVVKFEAHKPKRKANAESENANNNSSNPSVPSKELDLKRIRHEVVKFGMSGFDPSKKEEAKIALAVSLGAKPPKKPYVNYKELMSKRKEEKRKEREEREMMKSKSVMQTTRQKKKTGSKNDVGHFLSNYGKVQKKDLKKKDDKKSKKKKK